MRVLWTATGKKNCSESTSDRELIRKREGRKKNERAGHMNRRGEKIRFHNAGHALRVEKNQAVEEFNFVGGADTAIEVREIGAAAERHVLAIVHVLTIRQCVRSCTAAEVGPLFEEPYAAACFSQRDAGRQPRQPAANHDHVFRGHYVEYAARILLGR